MPDRVGHDGWVVVRDGMAVGSPHRHSRENGNPWMPGQVGHDGIEAAGARLRAVVNRLEPFDDS